MNSKVLDYILLTLVIIGAVNWGLIGFSALIWLHFSLGICPGFPESYMPLWVSAASICSVYTAESAALSRLNPKDARRKDCPCDSPFILCSIYRETMSFAFAHSGSSFSFFETLKTIFTLYFSLIISNFSMACVISSSFILEIVRKLSR